MRPGLRTVAAAGAAVAMLLVLAPPSGAAAPAANAHSLQLVEINSADLNNVQVVFRYDGPAADVAKFSATENGMSVSAAAPKALDVAQKTSGVVVVMDTSGSTAGSATLAEGRSAIKALLPKLASGTQLAVVAAGSDALLAQKFTTDATLINRALTQLTPQGDGALWEGVARAAKAIHDQPNMVGSIILITDGNGANGVSYASAKGQVLDAGATVYGFGLAGKVGSDPEDLAKLTGGRFTVADKATEASNALGGDVALLNGLYATSYKSG